MCINLNCMKKRLDEVTFQMVGDDVNDTVMLDGIRGKRTKHMCE